MTRNNTVMKQLIGHFCENDKCDWLFLFCDCIMCAMEFTLIKLSVDW